MDAGLWIVAHRTAALTAFWMVESLMWWRRTMPARGSVDRVWLGNTQNHPSSRQAFGYLRSRASGIQTPANPA